jgi:hypothetical protein
MVKNLAFTVDTFVLQTFDTFVLDYPNLGDWVTYLPDQAWLDLFVLSPSPVVVIAFLLSLNSCINTFFSFSFKKETDLEISDEEFWQDLDPEVTLDSDENPEGGPVPTSEPEELSSPTGEDVLLETPVEGDLIVDVELEPKNLGEVLVGALTELAEWLLGKARELLGLLPEVVSFLQEEIFPLIKVIALEIFKYALAGLAMVCWTWLVHFFFYLYIQHLSGWCCFMEDCIQSDWCLFLKNGVEQNFKDLCDYTLGKKGARYAAAYLQLFLFRSNLLVAVLVLALFKGKWL